MIIIGEKLNGSVPAVAGMIARRDEEGIRELVRREAAAGADYIDVCAAAGPDEAEALRWLVEVAQSAVEVPLSIDSPDVEALMAVYPACKKPGLFNSVSMEERKQMDRVFQVLSENPGWGAVVMLCDDRGIAGSLAEGERLRIFEEVWKKAASWRIEPSRLFIDPMVEAAAVMELAGTAGQRVSECLRTIRAVREICPGIHITSAISNISYGLPARRYMNYSFLTLALAAGIDSAICDPLDKGMQGMICAAEVLLGRMGEDGCLEYIGGYRSGRF